jgi:hypothetical protein
VNCRFLDAQARLLAALKMNGHLVHQNLNPVFVAFGSFVMLRHEILLLQVRPLIAILQFNIAL